MVDARNLAFARDSYISAARDSFLFLSFFFFFLGWGGGGCWDWNMGGSEYEDLWIR